MKKIYALSYSLLTGSIDFSNEIQDNDEFSYNPIEDCLSHLEIFIPGTEENLVKEAFLNSLEEFTYATLIMNRFMNDASHKINFSKKQNSEIKKYSKEAIEIFFSELKKLTNSK